MDRDVGDLHLAVLHARALHTVVEHDVAERTRRRDSGRTGRDRFLRTLVVDLLADRLFHPHARAAGATAHAGGPRATHLDDLDTCDRGNDLARREVDVVVATEIARAVVR